MNQAIPQICHLSHAGFRMLGEPVFRLSEGARIPSMVIQLSGQEAVLPLDSVAREFHVDPESADGHMLKLIAQSLEFVVSLKFGDKLPSEIIGGEASWQPDEQDRRIATSRMEYNLVRCVFARLGKNVSGGGGVVPGWSEVPRNRALLAEAITGGAAQLNDIDEAEVATRVAAISEELAYIENMRRVLSRGIGHIREKLLQIPPGGGAISQQETIKQVQALARIGINEIMGRFDEVDVLLDDVLAMLRDQPAVTAKIRRQRDWLSRTNRAWQVVFNDWTGASKHVDEFLLKVIERTYVFLAPRFMSFQEWTSTEVKMSKNAMKVKVW